MLLTTKYKDIPFEEAFKCAKPGAFNVERAKERWDTVLRGKPVTIKTPPIAEEQWKYVICKGPFYEVPGAERSGISDADRTMVCVHIAEIGD